MTSQQSPAVSAEDRSARVAVTAFPLLILAGAAVAFMTPETFTGIEMSSWVNPLLGVIMFGMGLTLTVPDFKLVVTRPLPVLLGVVAQFLIMPLLAALLRRRPLPGNAELAPETAAS